MSAMRLSPAKTIHDNVHVFNPKAYLDLEFKNSIQKLIGVSSKPTKRSVYLFNMSGVKLINSHGASAFIALYKHLSENDCVLAFCQLTNNKLVSETFKDTGLLWLCQKFIFRTEEEAIDNLLKHLQADPKSSN